MPRYHVNPSNQVRKCAATSEGAYPYGAAQVAAIQASTGAGVN